jgi:hypothetical protein
MMTPKTIFSIVLLSLIFPVQEFWQLWKDDSSVVNWWIAYDYPLSVQWYLKFLGYHFAELLKAIVIYRITSKIQALRMAAIVLLTYCIVDLLMFFVDFNRAPYALVYSTVGFGVIVIVGWRGIKKSLLLKKKIQFQ